MIIAFHGGSGRAWPFPQQGKWKQLVESEQVIYVQPLAELLPDNEGEWRLNTTEDGAHDIEFISTLIDKLSVYYCVDPKRIYAVGYSLGSMFTYEMACQLSDKFAAVASFAGTMPVSPDSCALKSPVGVMHIHGEKDPIIAYANRWDWKDWAKVGTMMAIPELVTYWKDKNACKTDKETPISGGAHVVHSDCDGGVGVEHYKLSNVGHEWPEVIDGRSTHTVIWEFLQRHSKP